MRLTVPSVRRVVSRPLLSEEEIRQVLAQCEASCPALVSDILSLKQRQGPFSSPFLGQGFEYQESRPWQAGDPLRQIDWRYFARTGQLFTRLYAQERQARLLLVVDLRQPMRFGTRVRLKAAQAIRFSIALAWQAQRQQQAVQVLPLWENGRLSPVWQGRDTVWQVARLLNQPLPPDAPTPDEWSHLQTAVEQLPAGSMVVLVGHLWDVPVSLAQWLGARHPACRTVGVWIWDQAERTLPVRSGMRLQSEGGQVLSFSSERIRTFNGWAQTLWQQQARALIRAGLILWHLRSDGELAEYEPVRFD